MIEQPKTIPNLKPKPTPKSRNENELPKSKNRRSLRRNKKKKFQNNLVLVGVNAAGISSKLTSFDDLLSSLLPSVFFIEETKLYTGGRIKTENSAKYQIFELNRKHKSGGGLAIGALTDVEPVLISEGDDNTEVLVVEISASRLEIRCICGYGPQENHSLDKKNKFWSRLATEVEIALENDKAIILQMDGNLWAGPEVVKNDPHKCNQNGQLFRDFLKMFPQLYVVNNLDLCQGLITRRRQTVHKLEESVLDFFIVCDKILPFVKRMIIDEEQKYVLSNYSKIKGKQVVKKSDHNPVILELLLEYTVKKPDRIETFNFRNRECQVNFCKKTDESQVLTKIFLKDGKPNDKCRKWFKALNGEFHKSFKKIRYTSKPKETEVSKTLEERRSIIEKMKTCQEDGKDKLQDRLTEIENDVCDLVAEKNYAKVVDNFKSLRNDSGTIQPLGIWNVKRRVFPKNKESLPTAKKNCEGKIITSQGLIKTLYLETFIHRLRHRPANDKYKYLKCLKEQLWQKRLKYSEQNKSAEWSETQLLKTLASLKNNKSRDPHGLVNELFKPDVIGQDLLQSLLMLFNQVKETQIIPDFMELCDIVGIYKGKGEKMDLNNDRGIFIVNIFRSILTKLIYGDKYETVDRSMSDSNVGARKRKSIRNHIFILNGIIQEALEKGNAAVDLLIADYRQCFDSLWLDECMNDLYEAGIVDDKLALIYKLNSTNQVAVKTPFGMTERKPVEKIVLQGEVFGPLQCSVTIDTFGKECLEEGKHLYMYKGEVGVPPLAMVDDVVCPTVCGIDTVEVTGFLNAKSNCKKIQFGVDKCHQLHFGVKKNLCPNLFIDNWGIRKADEAKTGFDNLQDVQLEDYKIESVEKDKYLGDIISTDGSNMKNVLSRKDKSIGINKQICSMLNDWCFGPFHFEVALIFRESMLLSSILTNCEAWYKVNQEERNILERCDENLLRMIFETPSTTPKCMLYLESGCRPIRFTIMKRRLMFLYYILNETEESLINRFFKAQEMKISKNDWYNQVVEDMDYLEICLTLDQIKEAPINQFIKLVDESIKEKSFEYLIGDKNKNDKGKVSHIKFKSHSTQEYLKSKDASIHQKKFIFLLRSRMLDLAANFPNKFQTKYCPLCQDGTNLDTQEHLMHCPQVVDENQLTNKVLNYEGLFCEDVATQIQISSIIQENYKKRIKKLKILQQKNQVNPMCSTVLY